MDRITLKHLRGACTGQRTIFKRVFPDGAPVTMEAAETALAAGLQISWLTRLLPEPAQTEYDRVMAPAQTEYIRVMASAQTEYKRVMASAWAECDRAIASAWAERDRVMASAQTEYDRAIASAQAEYDRAIAPALVRALQSL